MASEGFTTNILTASNGSYSDEDTPPTIEIDSEEEESSSGGWDDIDEFADSSSSAEKRPRTPSIYDLPTTPTAPRKARRVPTLPRQVMFRRPIFPIMPVLDEGEEARGDATADDHLWDHDDDSVSED